MTERRHLRLANSPNSDETAEDTGFLRVGDLARCTGKTVRAIHHYEDLGLIEPARRSKGHYRLFSPDAEVRVRWISKLQTLGLSLTEIQHLVAQRDSSPSALRAAEELRSVYEEKLSEVQSKIASLQSLERELEASLAYLDSCNPNCASEVTVTVCSGCDRHPETAVAPELVVGANVVESRLPVVSNVPMKLKGKLNSSQERD